MQVLNALPEKAELEAILIGQVRPFLPWTASPCKVSMASFADCSMVL